MNSTSAGNNPLPVDQYGNLTPQQVVSKWAKPRRPKYSDEIPPFDVVINFLNEYGQSAQMTIYGVEILNEGMGMSIDDITTEKACTFIARAIDDMTPDIFEEQ